MKRFLIWVETASGDFYRAFVWNGNALDGIKQARQDAQQRAQEQARAWQQKAQQRSQEYSQYQREHANAQSYTAQNRLEDAYSILNVSANCDERTLKKAYKRAMNEHHPDKLASKGLPEQALERAKAKTQDIQAAYELIKKERR